jgi:hypothetical protein
MKFSFTSLTGGPQLYNTNIGESEGKSENSFTPKANMLYQLDPSNMLYATYAKGFRPGGGNNPLPPSACAADLSNFGITNSPGTYNSDTVDSFEVGAKDSFDSRLRISSSIYYIKWHNIQQTVVPPICQISFITNLGEAVAKGGDLQVEWLVTDTRTPATPRTPRSPLRQRMRTATYPSPLPFPVMRSPGRVASPTRHSWRQWLWNTPSISAATLPLHEWTGSTSHTRSGCRLRRIPDQRSTTRTTSPCRPPAS